MRTKILALIALILLAADPAVADGPQRTISVTGYGEVAAKPDIARVTAGVSSFARTAAKALSDNAAAMNRVFTVLRAAGVAEKDMVTTNISLSPRWRNRQTQDGGRMQELVGYDASNQVRITSRDLDGLGALLGALTEAGGNELRGVMFDIADKAELEAEARRRAVRDGFAKAGVYAEAAGVALGQLISAQEAGGPVPAFRGRVMMESAAATPIAPGEHVLSASVALVFAIE